MAVFGSIESYSNKEIITQRLFKSSSMLISLRFLTISIIVEKNLLDDDRIVTGIEGLRNHLEKTSNTECSKIILSFLLKKIEKWEVICDMSLEHITKITQN